MAVSHNSHKFHYNHKLELAVVNGTKGMTASMIDNLNTVTSSQRHVLDGVGRVSLLVDPVEIVDD